MAMARATNSDPTVYFVCRCGQVETDKQSEHFGEGHPIISFLEKYGEMDATRLDGVRRWGYESALQYREQQDALEQAQLRKAFHEYEAQRYGIPVTENPVGSAKMLQLVMRLGIGFAAVALIGWGIWKILL